MLITLTHLLVLVASLAVAVAAGPIAADGLGLDRAWKLPLMVAALLVEVSLLWPVFRLLCLRPLILPLCPACGMRHGNFSIPRAAWPSAVIVCVHCGSPLRMSLADGVPEDGRLASASLRHPRFLGLWVHRQATGDRAGASDTVPSSPNDMAR